MGKSENEFRDLKIIRNVQSLHMGSYESILKDKFIVLSLYVSKYKGRKVRKAINIREEINEIENKFTLERNIQHQESTNTKAFVFWKKLMKLIFG